MNYRYANTKLDLYPYEYNYNTLVKEKLLGFSDFLGSFGGLIGLFAGISLISVFEVLFHIFDASVSQCMFRRRRNRVIAIRTNKKEEVLNRDHVLYQLMRFIKSFLSKSGIHGLNYVTNNKINAVGRFFWLIAVQVSTTGCSLLVSNMVSNSELSPIQYTVDDKIWTASEVSSKLLFMFF